MTVSKEDYQKLRMMESQLEIVRKDCDRLREAIETHRKNICGSVLVDYDEDRRLYAALQEVME